MGQGWNIGIARWTGEKRKEWELMQRLWGLLALRVILFLNIEVSLLKRTNTTLFELVVPQCGETCVTRGFPFRGSAYVTKY